ncbi:MAG TPA: ATP-binding protein [Wenzhouxiangella sp.]|nr:ATP-binding protein [Wenzhouxiangella sp.]
MRSWVTRGRALWTGLTGWLGRLPIADPVDRSNAKVLQVVFLCLLLAVPLMWAYRLALVDVPLRKGEGVALVSAGVITALSAVGVWLIRRGRFRPVVRYFLVAIAISLMLSYVMQGFTANRYQAPLQMAWLIMAGLMVSRRALWLLYAWIFAAVAAGVIVDVNRLGVSAGDFAADGLVTLLVFLLVTLLIDRTSTAFRAALGASWLRQLELQKTGDRLREEIARREQVHDQLIHSQKIEAAGRLAAGLAHDFNHLLTLIMSYRQAALNSTDQQSLEAALDGIDSATRRASAVSQRLLTFSGRGEASRESFDVNAALVDMQPMLRQLLGAEIGLAIQRHAGPLPVRMERGEFELVILNMAANARAAMPRGGRFEIAVSRARSGGGECALIVLEDSGCGMDSETLARAREPFYTRRSGGSGLGLTVAADVIGAAGGRLDIDSQPGRGTRVSFSLPLCVAADSRTDAEIT